MEPQTTADGVQDGRNTVDVEEGTQARMSQRQGFLNQLPTWSEFWRNEWLVMIWSHASWPHHRRIAGVIFYQCLL